MTYEEAVKYIEIHGEYYNELNISYKRKILPSKASDIFKYMSDLLDKKYISNEDSKRYSSDDKFGVLGFKTNWLNEG